MHQRCASERQQSSASVMVQRWMHTRAPGWSCPHSSSRRGIFAPLRVGVALWRWVDVSESVRCAVCDVWCAVCDTLLVCRHRTGARKEQKCAGDTIRLRRTPPRAPPRAPHWTLRHDAQHAHAAQRSTVRATLVLRSSHFTHAQNSLDSLYAALYSL